MKRSFGKYIYEHFKLIPCELIVWMWKNASKFTFFYLKNGLWGDFTPLTKFPYWSISLRSCQRNPDHQNRSNDFKFMSFWREKYVNGSLFNRKKPIRIFLSSNIYHQLIVKVLKYKCHGELRSSTKFDSKYRIAYLNSSFVLWIRIRTWLYEKE